MKEQITNRRAPRAPDALVEQVARLCVQTVAEVCAVYRGRGSLPIAFAARDPWRFESLSWAVYDDAYPGRACAIGLENLVIEPLVVDSQTAGVVVLADSGKPPSSRDARMVAGIFAAMIAQDDRLAYHTNLSDRLQRAMLPRRLVELEDGSLDSAYSPASRESDVGGDWYDAFDLGNGKVGISIGDETGHGLEAAVAMSEIRHALRSAAAVLTSTKDVLNTVDTIVASREIGMASAVIGIYDRTTHVLRYSTAGHPQPMLVTATGNVYQLPAGGALLGLGLCEASPEYVVTLSPGTTLVLYTDGLIEYDRDIIAGVAHFATTLEALAAQGMLYAQQLHGSILDEGPLDDCATLLLRRDDRDYAQRERYVYSALPSSARLARDAIRHYAKRCEISEREAFGLSIATGEAIANAIEHGEGADDAAFAVELEHRDRTLTIEVESLGNWRPASPSELRGRGLAIMRAYATSLQVSSSNERTRVSLEFAL